MHTHTHTRAKIHLLKVRTGWSKKILGFATINPAYGQMAAANGNKCLHSKITEAQKEQESQLWTLQERVIKTQATK